MGPPRSHVHPLRESVEQYDPLSRRHRECLRMFVDQDRINQMSFLDLIDRLARHLSGEGHDRSTMARKPGGSVCRILRSRWWTS